MTLAVKVALNLNTTNQNLSSISDCPISCNAVDLSKSTVRGLDLQLAVDKVASFYLESEVVRDDITATVDIICKFAMCIECYVVGLLTFLD